MKVFSIVGVEGESLALVPGFYQHHFFATGCDNADVHFKPDSKLLSQIIFFVRC